MSAPSQNSVIQIRRATPADAETCGRICYEAFHAISSRHNFPDEIPSPEAGARLLSMLFSHAGFYCVVAESDGRIAGSNCLDERSTIAAVGPITVSPGVQNSSIGRMLMQALLDRSRERNFPGVRLLQSAYHNRSLSLYAKLGFDAREPLSVMQGAPLKRPLEGYAVRPATAADLDAANKLCHRVHGHTRAGDVRDSIAMGTVQVVERSGRITGYTTGVGYFGHSVGEANEDIQALISAAPSFGGPGVIVPTRNSALFRWCLNNGLKVASPMTLMTVGLYNEPAGAYLPSILY